MTLRHYVAICISLGLVLVFSCSGSSSTGSHPNGHLSTPTYHRATPPAACSLPADPPCTAGSGCATDADCTAGPNGRCIAGGTTCSCRYNDCITDDDCAAGDDCACETYGGAGSSGNQPTKCVRSNCRTDADCGTNGFCSPSDTGVTSCGSLLGWFCHTPQDECGTAGDCVLDRNGALVPACIYSLERGIWVCSTTSICAG